MKERFKSSRLLNLIPEVFTNAANTFFRDGVKSVGFSGLTDA